MFKWAPYPFVRVTLSFIAGILLYFYLGKGFRYSTELLALFALAFGTAAVVSVKMRSALTTNLAGALGVACFLVAGFAITHFRSATSQDHNIVHLKATPSHYMGIVDDYVVQKPGYQSTVLSLQSAKVDGVWQQTEGKVQLSVPHDSDTAYELRYGDKILVRGAPQPVLPSSNPNQFDYGAFLANKNVFHWHALQPSQFLKITSDPSNPVLFYSIRLRRKLDEVLREQVDSKREYGISSALVLGVKDELDNSIKNAYASTGTMHVLAVSGLHVGLLYVVLMWILGKLGGNRYKRVSGAVIILSVLWLYAFMTGLSPSVLRAVLMFSLVTVALAIKRQTNIYNTLAIAAFVLLFYNPYFLFEVSFQLSFVAVLGIVYLQPRFYKLLEFGHPVADGFWKLFTVSVAAQLATLPLGLYYFHQFPVYFWLANLFVVPGAMLTLWSGVAALACSWIPFLGQGLFMLHTGFIWCMNEFNLFLTTLPQAVINGISISGLQTWMLYGLLLALILFFAFKKLLYLRVFIVIVAVLVVQLIFTTMAQQNQKLLTIYSLRGGTGMAFLNGKEAVLVSDSVMLHNQEAFTYNIQPHLWHHGIKAPYRQVLHTTFPSETLHALLPDNNSLYVWEGKRLLVLGKPLQVQPIAPLEIDYLLLTRNVKVNPEELSGFRFKLVLLDASNTPWYLQQMRDKLSSMKIPFYDVTTEGAFVVEVR